MNAMTRRLSRLASALLVLALACLGLIVSWSTQAHAATLCTQYGTTTAGSYVVQNNAYNTSGTQCLNVTSDGFQITQADGSAPTNGAPKSYPSIYDGCAYGTCSPGTNLPKQISSIAAAPTTITDTFVGNAVYDASYDIWLDPTPKTTGVNQTEIMIWLNRVGSVQPVGSQTSTATVDGTTWAVWTGNNGSNNVISFVAPSAMSSASLNVLDFIGRAEAQGLATSSWYLTSIQAGFEPWQNGAGLAVDSFSAAVQDAGSGGTGGGTGGSGAACAVSYTPSTWNGGFTANVTISNTGSATVDGWRLSFTLPAGESVTNAWNATVSPSTGSVTATALSYNAAIAPGGSQSFGFQGTDSGSYASPTGFSLNGTPCTTS